MHDQIEWYEKKGAWNKKWYMRMKVIETSRALSIPIMAGLLSAENFALKMAIGVAGVVVALSTNLVSLYKLQENWVEYRTVAELLKHKKFLYITKSGSYKNKDSFSVFVGQIEG